MVRALDIATDDFGLQENAETEDCFQEFVLLLEGKLGSIQSKLYIWPDRVGLSFNQKTKPDFLLTRDPFLAQLDAAKLIAGGFKAWDRLSVFYDPNCPFSRAFLKDLLDFIPKSKYTLRVYIVGPHKQRESAAELFACAEDLTEIQYTQLQSDWLLHDWPTLESVSQGEVRRKLQDCVASHVKLGRTFQIEDAVTTLGIKSSPSTLWHSELKIGAMTANEIQDWLSGLPVGGQPKD